MIISRHNYEEYFILYMDNELSSEQRREVESFVEKNPDLKEELELLQQFKLAPDDSVVFERKEELMSATLAATAPGSAITLANYEEWLVLYLDNELNASERKTADHLIATNASVKNEWNLLQRTRLQPEEIIFEGKSTLYRTEEKVRPMPFQWLRIAAAVLLVLIAGTIAVIVFNDRKASGNDEEIVKLPAPAEQKNNTGAPSEIPKETNLPVNETIAAQNQTKNNKPVQLKDQPVVAKENKKNVKDELIVNAPVQVKKEEPVIVGNNNKPSNNLPVPENDTRPVNKVEHVDVASNNVKEFIPLTNPKVTPTSTQTSNLKHASLGDDDTDDGTAGSKKSKLRGILRKVTRTFEKRTNIDATDGEDRLLVAGLAIKLK